eukprot:2273831-Rhodomonas_salina.1
MSVCLSHLLTASPSHRLICLSVCLSHPLSLSFPLSPSLSLSLSLPSLSLSLQKTNNTSLPPSQHPPALLPHRRLPPASTALPRPPQALALPLALGPPRPTLSGSPRGSLAPAPHGLAPPLDRLGLRRLAESPRSLGAARGG